VAYYKLLQYASSVIGCLVILVWFLRLPKTAASSQPQTTPASGVNDQRIFVASLVIAFVAGVLRALLGLHDLELFVSETAVTTISVFWFELVAYGILCDKNTPDMEAAT
jgi:small-conductance mechanosensitive channel